MLIKKFAYIYPIKLKIHFFDLRLKHTFRIAHDSRNIQKTVIVELTKDGVSGFGEATATKYYGQRVESIRRSLENNRNLIESYEGGRPEDFWNQLSKSIKNSFALSAVDCAIHDLYGKLNKTSLIDLWGYTTTSLPISSYTIGIDSLNVMTDKLVKFPWPNYKIKLGTEKDVEIIQSLRKLTEAIFRVDANCSWRVEETIRNSEVMQNLGVEFIEQPLPEHHWEGMKEVYNKSSLPIIADESIKTETDLEKCMGYFHGINIKLMKCGGLTPARRMIQKAQNLGLKVMVGCMTESSVGIAAISQLAPIIDYVDMDGALLIDNDLAQGPKLKDGEIQLTKHHGVGIERLWFS